MKRLMFLLVLLPVFCVAQQGFITTVAGNGTYGYSGDGGPATAALMGEALGNICFDFYGNMYIKDVNSHRIRQISPWGIIDNYAGGGLATAEGISALSSYFSVNAVAADNAGNIFLIDSNRIRKIDAGTGIITTIAGGSTAGYSGDGGPAIAAKFRSPTGIYLDATGNIYIGDEGNNRIRRINSAGIISTFAGNGTAGFSGDGGPATAAAIRPAGLCQDSKGNFYVADRYNNRIRKINTAGIITTYAGSTAGYSGDGYPAFMAKLNEPSYVCMDSYDNLYIADYINSRIRIVDPTGIINTFAGGGSSKSDGVPATTEALSFPWGLGVDKYNNIYCTDRYNYRIRKITGVGLPSTYSDSFAVFTKKLCAGPEMTIETIAYTPGMYIKTDYGDGTTDSSVITKYSFGGAVKLNHTYNNTGTYSITQILYRTGTPIDTLRNSYTYTFCRILPVKLYFDDNGNDVMDGTEKYMSEPSITQIDSSGVNIGKVSATGGFNYYAYAPPGTAYSFKVVQRPGNTVVSPGVTDTIGVPASYSDKYIGFSCPLKTTFDLSVNTVVPVTGVNDQWGNIYVSNAACDPVAATVTLFFSPKWEFDMHRANPKASSVTDNSATWDLTSLYPGAAKPVDIYYCLWAKAGKKLTTGDTVRSYYSITPSTDDIFPDNNIVDRVDTVRAGCDPNFVAVTPNGCIPEGTTRLQYTIHFENTGNDTAHNIYVLDTLPNEVDPGTLSLVMVSANMNISVFKSGANNIVRFDFPNINLQDSSHHGDCDGAIIFNIDLKKGLANGTGFSNRAGIYFDANDVVLTNAAENEMGCPAVVDLGIKNIGEDKVRLYPNPATNELTIQTEGNFQSITIASIMGQQLTQQEINSPKTKLDINQLPAGMYYVTVKGTQGISVVQFVKQ